MPELPEVETTLRGVSPYLVGKTVGEVIVRDKRLRWPVSADLHNLEGQRILTGTRRGKYLLFGTKSAGTLLMHLGMSGALRITDVDAPFRKHDHVALGLHAGKQLRFHDPRRFGAVLLIPPDSQVTEHALLAQLGPEPLDETAFSAAYLATVCAGRSAPIKAVIMDSKNVVGVGNIYACESLFIAGIDPRKPAGDVSKSRLEKLTAAIRCVLLASIEMGGTTLRDFLNEKGEPGYFAQTLRVYGRNGDPCPNCHAPVQRIIQSNRSTFFCAKCQK